MASAESRVLSLLNQGGGACTRGCTTADKLHWWGANIGDAGCRVLGEQIIERKLTLSNLLLGGNNLGDECIEVLSKLGEQGVFSSLKAIGLSRNRFTDAGCRRLATSIATGKWLNLRDLFMSNNEMLGDGCAARLGEAIRASGSKSSLRRIGLNDLPKISNSGLISLLSPLSFASGAGTTLEEISLKNCTAICDPATLDELTKAIGALSSSSSASGTATTTTTGGRRHLHLVLKSSERCRLAAADPRWVAAESKWQVGREVKVSIGRRRRDR